MNYKMSKTVTTAGTALICTVLMAACSGAEEQMQTGDSNEVTIQRYEIFGTDEIDSVENTSVMSDEVPAVSENTTEETLYEKFLNNEVTVYIEPDKQYGFDVINGTRRNLKEIAEFLVSSNSVYYSDCYFSGIEYGYLDCGMDGTPELLVVFYGDFGAYQDSEYMIFKEVDGELRMIYAMAGYEDCGNFFNMNGYLYEVENGGGGNYRIDQGCIDGDGNYHSVYHECKGEIFADLSGVDLNYGRYAYLEFWGIDPQKTDMSEPVCTYVCWDDKAVEFDYKNGLRHYFFFEVNKDESIYSEDNGLFAFYANEGIEITPISEVEQMIAEKEEQLGVTEELKNAPDVILQSLDVPFEVISKTSE